MYIRRENLRILKEPFGLLLKDKEITSSILHGLLGRAKMIVSVGDATTDRLSLCGIVPSVYVVDGKERREPRMIVGGESHSNSGVRELRCSNPAGTISKGALRVLKEALVLASESRPVKVFVDGEEDLLALPLLFLVPDGSVILYGQPLEGIVVVKVSPEVGRKAKDLMDKLEINSNWGHDDAVAV
jgi:uncharacterized protein (UPF0218 family)